MAVVFPLSLPDVTGVRNITLRQINAVTVSRSPFTFAQQAIAHTGQQWEVDVNLPPMKRDKAAVWVAWLSSLNGQLGTFTLGDPSARTPQGSAGGSPVIDGAAQIGQTLNVTGGTASQTGWLKAGDYIQVGSGSGAKLHMNLQDVDTDGAGSASLELWPNLRSSPVDGSALVTSNAMGLWRLGANTVSWDINQATIHGVSFTAKEVI